MGIWRPNLPVEYSIKTAASDCISKERSPPRDQHYSATACIPTILSERAHQIFPPQQLFLEKFVQKSPTLFLFIIWSDVTPPVPRDGKTLI